jgi:16S rRNA U1498 N3-methylase RsmE
VELAQSNGFIVVSMGPRILRSETAPVVALATLMYHTDNL